MSGLSRWGHMSERKQFRAIKGTRDILPPDSALWNWFEHTAREVFESYNFGEIRLPIFEETTLYARSIGEETDVVAKEMYTFQDRGTIQVGYPQTVEEVISSDEAVRAAWELKRLPQTPENELRVNLIENACRSIAEEGAPALLRFVAELHALDLGDSITLRPEATASVCRAYIEYNMQALPANQKLYYIGPMFRRERPQKGRYRQFYQIGAEVLGQSDAPAIDAEVLEMLLVFFNRVGLTRTTLYVNSIGDKNCRPRYVEQLRKELLKVKDRLKEDSQRRIETNPLRVLDSKIPDEQPIIEKLPRISDHLCDDCRAHFAKLKEELNLRGIEYRENWRLVRGLDYYTRTTFEVTAEGLGSQNAVCGGGRYDGLVELLGGPPTKGIGFAIGEDRLILSLQEQAREAAAAQGTATEPTVQSPLIANQPPLIFIAWMGHNAYATAVRAAKDLRTAGFPVEVPTTELKFGKALGQADKLGAQFALILGENEISEGLWTLKNLTDGNQLKLSEPDLIAHLRSL